jgi:hypothetical protein
MRALFTPPSVPSPILAYVCRLHYEEEGHTGTARATCLHAGSPVRALFHARTERPLEGTSKT